MRADYGNEHTIMSPYLEITDLVLAQIVVQHPSQDWFQACRQDMKGDIVAHAEVVEGLEARINPKRRLHYFESFIERYLHPDGSDAEPIPKSPG